MPSTADDAHEADEALMQRYCAGDVSAFDALYRRHASGVWRFVLRNVRVQALADDLLQDVWFAVARQAGHYRPTARFRTWLFTIARNRVVDHVRATRPHLSLDADAGPDGAAGIADTLASDPDCGPLRQLEARQQGAALLAAVEQLPHEQREAFLLQAEGGLSVQEIAHATGVGFEAAKSRLRYARNSLRRILEAFA